jgi:vancomycin resistance protein YoaR
MRAEVDVGRVRGRRRARPKRSLLRTVAWPRALAWAGGGVLALALTTGVVFAGSADRIAAGVRVGGLNVAGKTPEEARTHLDRQARRYASVPVVLSAGAERFTLRPRDLDARVDWNALALEAQDRGNWPLPFRGINRVAVRLFGSDVPAIADVYEPRLEFELDRMAKRLDRPGRNAAIVLDGLEPEIVPGQEGRTLDKAGAARVIQGALGGFERSPFELPVRIGPPDVTTEDLEPALAQARTALSAPVRFGWRDAHWTVQPKELARLLELPDGGRTKLRIGGKAADRYFGLLARAVDRKPREARFEVAGGGRIRIVPSVNGRALDVKASAAALLAAALSTEKREAELVVGAAEPQLTTARAREMGITRILASYTTAYSGSANRIQNLRRAAVLIDGAILAPTETFSFNNRVGPRTEKRGFRTAPTIVDGEYKDKVGGGVSQVATTMFNAAWEAGLKIVERTAHSLYIARYPLGRDATVNYPDVDFKFTNDTKNYIVVRAIAGSGGITINLLGAPTNRRIETEVGEFRVVGEPEMELVPDPTLFEGQRVVEDEGEPARAVSVKRTVYLGDRVLHEETWYTSFRSEPKIVRVGTIPVEEEEAPAEPTTTGPKSQPTTTSTTPTPTTPTTTGTKP